MKTKLTILGLYLSIIFAASAATDWSQLLSINLGTPPNQNGDTLYHGGQKINGNFVFLAGLIADLQTNVIVITNTITGAPGTPASVVDLGTPRQPILQFTLPAGTPGSNAVTVTLTNTITGPPGSSASVANLGTTGDALLQFTLPAGADGAQGTNATVTTTVTLTGPAGSQPSVANVGTPQDAVLQFTLPQGVTNVMVYATNGVVGTVTFSGGTGTISLALTNQISTFSSTNGFFTYSMNSDGGTNVTFVVTNVPAWTISGIITNQPYAKTFSSTNGFFTFTHNLDGTTNVKFVLTNVPAGIISGMLTNYAKTFSSPNGTYSNTQNSDGSTNVNFVITASSIIDIMTTSIVNTNVIYSYGSASTPYDSRWVWSGTAYTNGTTIDIQFFSGHWEFANPSFPSFPDGTSVNLETNNWPGIGGPGVITVFEGNLSPSINGSQVFFLNAAGSKFRLIVNSTTNGFTFAPQ